MSYGLDKLVNRVHNNKIRSNGLERSQYGYTMIIRSNGLDPILVNWVHNDTIKSNGLERSQLSIQ